MKKLPVTKTKTTPETRSLALLQQELFARLPSQSTDHMTRWAPLALHLLSLTSEELVSLYLSEDEEGMHVLPYEAIMHQLDFHNQSGSFDLPRLEADLLKSRRDR